LCSSTQLFPTPPLVSSKFPHVPLVDGLWATKIEGVGLIVSAISFTYSMLRILVHQHFRRTDKRTDRQTDDRKTALLHNTYTHHAKRFQLSTACKSSTENSNLGNVNRSITMPKLSIRKSLKTAHYVSLHNKLIRYTLLICRPYMTPTLSLSQSAKSWIAVKILKVRQKLSNANNS